MAPDLTKQFSLDYLISGSRVNAPVESSASSRATLDSVFDLLSRPILKCLADAKDQRLQQFALIDQLRGVYGDVPPETLTEVVKRLAEAGRIRLVERDRYGNHLLQFVPPTA